MLISWIEWVKGKNVESSQRISEEVLVLRDTPVGIPSALLYAGGYLIYFVQLVITINNGRGSVDIIGQVLTFLMIGALIFSRNIRPLRNLLICYLLIVMLGAGFDLVFSKTTFEWVLFTISCMLLFRLPLRWSLPCSCFLLGIILLEEEVISMLTKSPAPGLFGLLIIAVGSAYLSLSFRSRQLLINRLRRTQVQLHVEMEHTAQMATLRERTRIARDIHDILAHSLTVLSIQIQAARVLFQQQPEQVPEKLEQMATLLRESQAESRRIVGLLRDSATDQESSDPEIGLRLQESSARFAARTGIECFFNETGVVRPLSVTQQDTLQYALQEALTNASRHGKAQHIWIKLFWQEEALLFAIRDDGKAQETGSISAGTHNGLRGMNERVSALGGTLESGPYPGGGFAVTLSLPLDIENREGKNEYRNKDTRGAG